MPLPTTLLPVEHYAEHFLGNLEEAVEHGKVVVGDTTTTYFGLSTEALAALEKLK